MRSTLVGRVASVQALVTLAALAVVVVATWIAVTFMLTHQTDRLLADLLARTLDYLEAGSAGEVVDWPWLAGEIDESRPRDVRLEVRDRDQSRPRIALGAGTSLGRFEPGCRDRGSARICARAGARYLVLAARERAPDLAIRNQLMLALTLACLAAGTVVAFASVSVTRRAIRPLAELAERMAGIEPGQAGVVEAKATLHELDVLERHFVALIARFDQALVREKQLTAHASHELRTPLTIARAEVEALPNSQAAVQALARLESLIQVILWFARTQAPLHGDDMEVVNLADVLAEQLSDLGASARSRTIHGALPDEALVRGDEQLLRRATWNLLDNAVQHGDDSDIEVAVTRSNDQVVVRVTNGGRRIAAQMREQVFVPFVRGPSGSGFGLGLPYARAVARAHGGDVTLDSDSAAGTSLRLCLPLIGWHEEPAR